MRLQGVSQVAPLVLQRLLATLLVHVNGGDDEKKRESLRECLIFLVPFFASICSGARQCLEDKPEITPWAPTHSVVQSQESLAFDLARLMHYLDDPMAASLLGIFFEKSGEPYLHTRLLGIGDPPEEGDSLAKWCLNPGALKDLDACFKMVDSWLALSEPFFQEADYHYEPGADFGQRSLTIAFRQHRIQTRFGVRLAEARSGQKLSRGLPLGAPPSRAMPLPQISELGELVADLLEKRKPGETEQLPPEARTVLNHSSEYLGFAKDAQGRLGHAGKLRFTCEHGGEIRGSVKSTNPNLVVVPGTFKGEECNLAFWLDPAEMPHPEGYVEVETPHEKRRIAISTLVPPSRLSNLSGSKLATLLLAPSVVGLAYICWVYHMTIARVMRVLTTRAPDLVEAFTKGYKVDSFRRGGVGVLDLEILPRIESATLLLLLFSVLAPLVTTKLFRFYPRSEKRRFGALYAVSLVLPTLGLLAFWNSSFLWSPVLTHPELTMLDYRNHFIEFSVFNIVAAVYLFLSVTGVLDRWIRPQFLRVLLSPLMFLGWLTSVGILVYARSWLGW